MKYFTGLLFLAMLTFTSCKEDLAKDDGVLRIVATTGMLGDVAKSIVGDKGEVVSLMGPGVDPHLYKATQGDLKLLKQADIIVYNGLHLEGKMGEILEKLSNFPNKKVIAAAEVIQKDNLIISDDKTKIYDPHVWFDVDLWSQTIDPVLNAILQFDEADAISDSDKTVFKENAVTKKSELSELDLWVKEQLSTIPDDQRTLITAHDAFAYFGRAYDIDVKGLQGISTLSEAGIKDVTNLVDEIVEDKIKAVFVESSVPRKSLEAVVEGAKSQGHDVVIGGTLFSDAMGEEGSPEGTYKGMVEHNINTIVEALR